MTDQAGGITFARTYDPYGVVTYTSGTSQTAYGFTGEQYGDATQLLYLRARYYNPAEGRFVSKDPSRQENNLYNYAKANPVNRVDPSGLYSKEAVLGNINYYEIVSSPYSWTDHSKWGFYALLRDAENGDLISSGYVPIVPPLLGGNNSYQVWTKFDQIYDLNCKHLMIGHQLLSEYFRTVVDQSYDKSIWWRDTTRTHYQLRREGSLTKRYYDGFDYDMSSYPQFVGISFGLAFGEIGYLVDVHGYKYLSISFGPGAIVGVGIMEGYLCNRGTLWSMNCSGGLPSNSEIEQAVSGICLGGEIVALTGLNIGALCKDYSFTNWNILTSHVTTYYAGIEFGGGGGVTITIPLSWFGVPANPNDGWEFLISQRRYLGMTRDKVIEKGLY
jgi:RHS repeat-associated protein